MASTVGIQNWQPAKIFAARPVQETKFAVIVLNQPLELPPRVYRELFANACYSVAADGGANRLYTLNKSSPGKDLLVDSVVGDFDSILPEVRKSWEERSIPFFHDEDQYSTDFTKAVSHIRQSVSAEVIDVVALGGLGGRVDQGMSVLHHLYMFQNENDYSHGKMYLLSSESITFVLKSGTHSIKVKDPGLGTNIGIIPLKEPGVITTKGLEWDVEDWKTEFGGHISTSNHVREDVVIIETTKDVLFTIDLDFSD